MVGSPKSTPDAHSTFESKAQESDRSDPSSSNLEPGAYTKDDAPPIPRVTEKGSTGLRDESGMAVNQEAALASLDPRTKPRGKVKRKEIGTSSEAVA